ASGFLYYVSVAGVTGGKQATVETVRQAVDEVRRCSELPVAVGFGISTPEKARALASVADAVVVGSAIVNRIADSLDEQGQAKPNLVEEVLTFVEGLAKAVHQA
ncbi:MAG: tryptophan synthase subunit alpha, partial [Pseudomonadota bacterium]|nr:tryptophan synthase subunit alpha [Pseudomonadota bacterium]